MKSGCVLLKAKSNSSDQLDIGCSERIDMLDPNNQVTEIVIPIMNVKKDFIGVMEVAISTDQIQNLYFNYHEIKFYEVSYNNFLYKFFNKLDIMIDYIIYIQSI